MNTIYDWMKDGFTVVPNILFSNYAQLNIDSDEMLVVLYLLSKTNQGDTVDEMKDASQQLGWSQSKIASNLNSLMEKDYVSIELKPDASGRQSDHYTLRPLFEKLEAQFFKKDPSKNIIKSLDESQIIVQDFEKEFGRPLSPVEIEKIAGWLNKDHYAYDLIKLALREAVIHGVRQITYIDRILINWENQNITTVAQAENQIRKFNEKNNPTQFFEQVDIPIIDWADLDA